MRGLFGQVGRGLVVMAVVVSLAAPVSALPRDREEWSPGKVIKALKRYAVKALGDLIIVPRP